MSSYTRRKLSNIWLPDMYVVLRQQEGESSQVYIVRRENGKGGEPCVHPEGKGDEVTKCS